MGRVLLVCCPCLLGREELGTLMGCKKSLEARRGRKPAFPNTPLLKGRGWSNGVLTGVNDVCRGMDGRVRQGRTPGRGGAVDRQGRATARAAARAARTRHGAVLAVAALPPGPRARTKGRGHRQGQGACHHQVHLGRATRATPCPSICAPSGAASPTHAPPFA